MKRIFLLYAAMGLCSRTIAFVCELKSIALIYTDVDFRSTYPATLVCARLQGALLLCLSLSPYCSGLV